MPRARATAAKKAAPKRAPKKVAKKAAKKPAKKAAPKKKAAKKPAKKAAPKKKWTALPFTSSHNGNLTVCAWIVYTFTKVQNYNALLSYLSFPFLAIHFSPIHPLSLKPCPFWRPMKPIPVPTHDSSTRPRMTR